MYASIRRYSIKAGFMEEVMRCIQGEFVFLIRQEPGFLDYYALRVGPNEVLTISIFDSQAGAEGSTPLAFEWVHQNLESFVQGVPEATIGQVFAGAYEPAGLGLLPPFKVYPKSGAIKQMPTSPVIKGTSPRRATTIPHAP